MSEIGRRSSGTAVERVLGGRPGGVFVRLIVLSFVVGLILRALDLDPRDIVGWVEARINDLSGLGLESLETVGSILVLGAVVVVPIWLILRVVRLLSR